MAPETAQKETAKANPRRVTIMQLLRPHKRALFLGLAAMVGESVADVLTPWPLKIVLDNVLGQKTGHGWLNSFIHSTAGYAPSSILIFAVIAVLVIALFDAIVTYTDKYITTTVGQWVTHDLRSRMYAQVQRLSMTYHDHNQTGDLISRITTDIDSVQSFITSGMLTMLVDIITVLAMIGVMFHLNWQLTLVSMAVVPVLFAIVYTYTRAVKKASRNVRKQESKLLSAVQEVLGSIRVVKAFAREDYETHRLEGESLETVEASLAARQLKARLVPLVTVVTGVGTALVLYFGGKMALGTSAMSAGSIYLFITYIRSMYKPMQDISKGMDSYSKADIGYERIQEVLTTDNEMHDMPGAKPMPPIKGQIDMEHVSFAYNEKETVLRDVNLHVGAGTTVALVGPTGSGKSTVANLVARFYDPTEGVVKIDGIDVKTVQQESLREQISFVLQDTVLFTGTIWDNIAYGNPKATHQEIVQAAKDANAMEFIDRLPEKFNAVVGERGLTLSGGQRQRIAIARAIVRNTPLLILDEPSSGLDAASEELVFEALDRLMKGKTSIVIAHRLSTIRSANCIFVIKDGTVVECGTHQELMEHEHGEYRELFDIQFNTEEASATIGG